MRKPASPVFFQATLLMAVLFLAGAGCSVGRNLGPKYQRPAATMPGVAPPAAFKEPPPTGWKEAQPRDEAAKGDWWTIFDDPVLNDLETQATRQNQNLQAAMARVEQARFLVASARAELLPMLRSDTVMGGGRAAGNRPVQPNSSTLSYNYGTITLPVDMTYEVDLFGAIRKRVDVSRIDVSIASAQYENILLTLKADVARTYFMVRGMDTDRSVLARNIEVQKRELEIARSRHDGGLVSGLDVAQAETQVNSTQAEYVGLERARAQVEHALAVLIGQPASSFTVTEKFQLRVPPVIPEGLPSDLLERRPDIAAAERAMAESNARIGIARAAFFPTLPLAANGGFFTRSLATLFAANSATFLVTPLLSTPIFQGGRQKANLEAAKKEYEESVAHYRQRVLTAFQEAEDGLSDLRILQAQGVAVDETLKSARRGLDIATARYQQGLTTYLEVLDANRVVLANERLAAQTLGFRMVASVQLIKALGGGWADRPLTQP